MVPAPYVIVGYFVTPGVPEHDEIIADIARELGAIATPFLLPPSGVVALRATKANMYDVLDHVATLMVNINQAHGGVVHWFAQLCDEPWFAAE